MSVYIVFFSLMIVLKFLCFIVVIKSGLRKYLYDFKIKKHETELHKIKNYLRRGLFYDFAVIFAYLVLCLLQIQDFYIYVYFLIAMVFELIFFRFIVENICKIFVYPTNE